MGWAGFLRKTRDSSREGGRTKEALSRYLDEGSLTKETLEPETAVYTRILS